jgi:hypothetical protein
MKRVIHTGCLMFFFMLSFTALQARAALLTGGVSFDDVTDLYTYTYTLDTTDFTGNITEIAIHHRTEQSDFGPLPVSTTQPDGWQFALLTGSVGNGPFMSPENIFGSFWGWLKNPGNEGADIETFSFVTERAPTTSSADNYGLYNNDGTIGSSFIEKGNIVGPEILTLGVSPVPENDSYALMLAGLGLMGFIIRRRSKYNP